MSKQQVPAGLVITRNIAAAVGGVMLLLGLVAYAVADALWRVPMWIGVTALAAAAGIALVTTDWKAMGAGTRVIVAAAVLLVAVVIWDAVN